MGEKTKTTKDETKQSSDDNNVAWEINSEPKDGPDWDDDDLHSRSPGDQNGEAWEINENTVDD